MDGSGRPSLRHTFAAKNRLKICQDPTTTLSNTKLKLWGMDYRIMIFEPHSKFNDRETNPNSVGTLLRCGARMAV